MADSDSSENFEVAHIIKQRRNKRGKLEYLVRWRNYGSSDDSWEPVENLRNCTDVLDAFNDRIMREKGLFPKSSPSHHKSKKGKTYSKDRSKRKLHSKKTRKESKSKTSLDGLMTLKREGPQDEFKIEIKNETDLFNGNGIPLDGIVPLEPSPSSLSSTSEVKTNVSPVIVRKFHRARSMSCMPYDTSVKTDLMNGDGHNDRKRRRVNSLRVDNGDITEKSVESPTTTPPSTPTNGDSRLTFVPLLTPVIKLHDFTNGNHIKLPSPKSLLSTEKFLRAKLKQKQRDVADRFSGEMLLRRVSQSSLSSEEDEGERRFSLRQSDNLFKYKEVCVRKYPEYTQVWFFTNSHSRNALNVKALQELTDILDKSAKDETRVLLLTGSGNVFCSGLDLQMLVTTEHKKKVARKLAEALRVFINAMINFPKVIVAAVNGTAVGLGAAILPLCDIVYSSDKAEFHLPYAALGQPPEACSSFTFPNAMGLPVACDLLYSGRRMTALEACASGLVSQVLWPNSFMREVIPRVKVISGNSVKGIQMTKSLVRSHLKSKLEFTNESECAALQERWGTSECNRLIRKHLELT
ncbi:chromodomain Y-like protein 2 [Asterias amurensis]|uniref:chromodomain Y-like protein 2 n=1 Tax=Asterias amurensis TaxID=7602 RepID=UPI003AB58865